MILTTREKESLVEVRKKGIYGYSKKLKTMKKLEEKGLVAQSLIPGSLFATAVYYLTREGYLALCKMLKEGQEI